VFNCDNSTYVYSAQRYHFLPSIMSVNIKKSDNNKYTNIDKDVDKLETIFITIKSAEW
jgi:hypothetical protein